jgi:hypothetical protein
MRKPGSVFILILFAFVATATPADVSAQYYIKKKTEQSKPKSGSARPKPGGTTVLPPASGLCTERELKTLEILDEGMEDLNEGKEQVSARGRQMIKFFEDSENIKKMVQLIVKCRYGQNPG